MKLTTRGRYAVTAMLDLVLNSQNVPCSLNAIATRQGLPQNYLEQLFTCLRRNGLVTGVRGNFGGYSLARPASEISVEDILKAVDMPLDVTRCSGKGDCQSGETCITHHLWVQVGEHLRNLLGNITLADLSSREEIMKIHGRQQHNAPDQDTPLNLMQS